MMRRRISYPHATRLLLIVAAGYFLGCSSNTAAPPGKPAGADSASPSSSLRTPEEPAAEDFGSGPPILEPTEGPRPGSDSFSGGGQGTGFATQDLTDAIPEPLKTGPVGSLGNAVFQGMIRAVTGAPLPLAGDSTNAP